MFANVTFSFDGHKELQSLKTNLEDKGLKGDLFSDYLQEFEKHIIGVSDREKLEELTYNIECLCDEKKHSYRRDGCFHQSFSGSFATIVSSQ